MKRFILLLNIGLLFLFNTDGTIAQNMETLEFDAVIIGGTPAAIMAAIALDREDKTSVIIERTHHIGGLPANGLGATDIKTKDAVGGLFKEFIRRVDNHYKDTYGSLSHQHRSASHGYHFEPSIAESIFEDLLNEANKVTVLKRHQFDAAKENIVLKNNVIQSVRILNRDTGKHIIIKGKQFIDATYEGDLIAAAGVEFKVGREGKEDYNEPLAGKVYKYWDGPIGEGSTYEGDNAIQAFNYRLCLTNNPEMKVPIAKPDNYDRSEYVSLINDVITGRHTGKKYAEFKEEHPDRVAELAKSEGSAPPNVPGNPEGISRLVNLTKLPNDKSDANNQHLAFISTDLPEENWFWPNGSWEERDAFAKRLRDYTLGLFYFAQNDNEVPQWFRDDVSQWGLDKEEYQDNDYFPRQVYVREGRRMNGVYLFTALDALPVKKDQRPPLHKTSITAGHYSIDSHGVRKREENRVHLDGFISYDTKPFNIPYGVIVPKTIKNLLAPVPVSGTHLGFSAIRLEPTWMALGEAAGLAASLSMSTKKDVQDISIIQLQKQLLEQHAVLIYFEDMKSDEEGFKGLQLLALNGVYHGWEIHPHRDINPEDILTSEQAFGIDLNHIKGKHLKRFQLANEVYKSLKYEAK